MCQMSECLLYPRLDLFRRYERTEPVRDVPVPIDQEFGEVPFDIGACESVLLLGLQESVQRRFVIPVDIYLRELSECDIVSRPAELMDVVVAAGCLRCELVAGEVEYLETPVLVFSIDSLQPFVLGCETAAGGGIHYQKDLSLELVHIDGFSEDVPDFEIINPHVFRLEEDHDTGC